MDLRKLKTIIELFESSGISEMELSEGEERLRLAKDVSKKETVVLHQQADPMVKAPELAEEKPSPKEEKAVPDTDQHYKLKSPMVGTYYAQASEDSEPFAKEGDHVTEGDTLCIIEAMKLFNNVSSPVSGTIRKIVAKNAEPVGYGDTLMEIEVD